MTAVRAYEIARKHFERVYSSGLDFRTSDVEEWCRIAFRQECYYSGRPLTDGTLCNRIAKRIVFEFPQRGDGHIRYACVPTFK